jgi:hypothetical protein
MLVIGRPLTLLIFTVFLILFLSSFYNGPSRSVRIRTSTAQWNWPESLEEANAFTAASGVSENRDGDPHRPSEKAQLPHAQEPVMQESSAVEEYATETSSSIGIGEYLRDLLRWQRPNRGDHWPPYNDYKDRDYDPNRWEAFQE